MVTTLQFDGKIILIMIVLALLLFWNYKPAHPLGMIWVIRHAQVLKLLPRPFLEVQGINIMFVSDFSWSAATSGSQTSTVANTAAVNSTGCTICPRGNSSPTASKIDTPCR